MIALPPPSVIHPVLPSHHLDKLYIPECPDELQPSVDGVEQLSHVQARERAHLHVVIALQQRHVLRVRHCHHTPHSPQGGEAPETGCWSSKDILWPCLPVVMWRWGSCDCDSYLVRPSSTRSRCRWPRAVGGGRGGRAGAARLRAPHARTRRTALPAAKSGSTARRPAAAL